MPQRTSLRRERLGPGPEPARVASGLQDRPGLVCLTGAWADGSALVTCDPVVVVTGRPAVDALDVVPVVDGVVTGGWSGNDAGTDGATADGIGGGWFGVLAFDGRHQLAFHDWVLRQVDGVWWFESLASDGRAELVAEARRRAAAVVAGADLPVAQPTPATPLAAMVGVFGGPPRDEHLAAVEHAVGHIRAGDIYQVNVCTRLVAAFTGEPVALFARAVEALAPPYAAYADLGERALLSLSPELFLRRRGRDVLTAPIKGTRPRGAGSSGADELRRSAKDAAENVMIVDLMRNDLGRVCETGSVSVDALLDIEPHPGVWHLVSRVRGRLRPGVADAELLHATFPPGSVTGAPKLRAVEIIDAVERQPRGAYTGAVGFISPLWGAEFNVAIRTFEFEGGKAELGVGGGVTADSVPMLEWQECLHKAAPLLAAVGARPSAHLRPSEPHPASAQLAGGVLETVLVVDGRAVRLADHLARLDRSCRELFGFGVPRTLDLAARTAAAEAGNGRHVLRVVANAAGFDVSCTPAPVPPAASVARTVVRTGGLWRHKWADRTQLQEAESAVPGTVPLFVAADGAVLETSRGNPFLVRSDGSVVAPPLRDDLLPGVTRRALLDLFEDAGRPVSLRPFGVDEMREAVAFWTSSLSLAVPITAVDGVPTLRDDALVASFAAALAGGISSIR